MDYLDFELEIDIGSGGEYPVAVIRSPAGEAHETMHLPFDEQALDNQLLTLQNILLNSGETDAQNLATGEQTIQRFGQTLFEALFTGQVRDLYVASRTAAESQDKGLRVKLRLQAAELAALPWEFLYDAGQGQYLCLSDKTPLVRYVELPIPCQPLTVMPPLSILGMTASPQDLPELDVTREQQRITTALAPLQARGLTQVTWLVGHTWEDLQQALLAGPWHIFHFIGHGGFDTNTHQGVIMLEDKAGQSHSLSATQLGMLLADHHTLRLVVLSSCQGAKGSTRASFSSTALQVVRHGIPAVLAHQYDISDEAAITLSRTFYAALAAGMPVDTALGEARKAIRLGGGQSLEWGTPVLHLHAPDGVLFQLTPPADLAASTPTGHTVPQTASIKGPPNRSTPPSPLRTAVISSAQAASLSIQEPLAASLVRIRTTDGRVVGAGFLVGARQALTCAHVISQALGLDDAAVDLPPAAVSLDFPFVPPHTRFVAKVVLWCPALADGSGDIAGLELQGEPPAGVEAVRFATAEDVWEHPFRAFGFPAGYDDGVWATGCLLGRQATDWIMIEDVKAQGFAVAPGFSGTPVWDTQLQGVVGMVVAASRPAETKAAFVIPLEVLAAAWPLIEPITRQRVFLSAAPADSAFADRLRADLEARDIVVWSEQQTPENGQSTKEEGMRQAIRAAQAVVLVISSQTRSSRTVKEHLRLADVYSRRLILVWVGDDEHAQPQHYGWQETTWVDAHSTQYTAALDAIETNLSQRRSISALLGSSGTAPAQEPRNPYKGLHAFTADDAGDFFGRDRMVDEVIKDIRGMLATEQPTSESGRLLTIIGPSGSGKSSIVMAGLLPKLQHGALHVLDKSALYGSEQWVYLEPMVPGKRPIEALALTLKPHFPDTSFKTLREDLEDDATRGLHLLATQLVKPRGSTVVLLVDQFEELFTQTESEDERQRFIDLLLTATTEPRGPLLVLLTLRADFSHRLMQYPELYRLVKAHEKPLFPMEVDDLRATIEQPAALPDVQLTFEGNLVGDLLFEMQGQAGALPLLQFTLDQLFQKRSGHRLTLQAYRDIGGVKGALSQHAEQTYAALPSEEHRRLARALFLRLIDPGTSEQDTTRRRASFAELSLADAKQTVILQEVAAAFITARLLITNEVAGTTTIEVSHEALIREWPRLSDWLREGREDIQLQQAVSQDVAEWERREKPKDRLYRGSQLKEAKAWARRNTPSRDETDFLQASTLRERNVRNLSRFLIGIASVVLVGVLLVGLVLQGNLLATQGRFLATQKRLLASLPVSVININDSGPGSLRDAIKNAKDGDAITFAKTLTEPNGQQCDTTTTQCTITLTGGELEITKSITISGPSGPSGPLLTISGQHKSRIFNVHTGAAVQIFNLVIRDGSAPQVCTWCNPDGKGGYPNFGADGDSGVGGAIFNGRQTTLALTNVIVSGSQTGTGAIFNNGTLILIDSRISDNKTSGILNLASTMLASSIVSGNAAAYGGGINNWGNLTVINSTISGNRASNNGGGIYNLGRFKLANSTISGNQASGGGGGIYNNMGIYIENDVGINNGCGDSAIDYSTIYLNKAAAGGGGIASNNHSCNSGLSMQASIVASNSALSGPDILGPIVLAFLNLIQDTSGAEMSYHCQDHSRPFCGMQPIVGQSPMLGPLQADKPGQPPTHALLPGSPARDQLLPDRSPSRTSESSICDNVYNDFDSSRDERGVSRPQGFACDLGAYEANN